MKLNEIFIALKNRYTCIYAYLQIHELIHNYAYTYIHTHIHAHSLQIRIYQLNIAKVMFTRA